MMSTAMAEPREVDQPLWQHQQAGMAGLRAVRETRIPTPLVCGIGTKTIYKTDSQKIDS